jgi:hypothetical protein
MLVVEACHLTGTRMRQTLHMLWIGAIFGALFGWIGILFAALFWATLAVFKLIWVLSVFAFQLLLAVGALLARAIIWLFNQVSDRVATRNATAQIQTMTASTRKNKAIPTGLKPKRKKRRAMD